MTSLGLPLISIFSGMGGLDQGLENSGLDIKVCIEMDGDRVKTLKKNRPNWNIIHDSIENVSTCDILKKAELNVSEAFMLAGGPPCQSFSKSAYWVSNRRENIASDPRSKMLDQFLRVVKEAKPRTFILENVSGLSYKPAKSVLDAFLAGARSAGYVTNAAVLNAADYGVPQKRKRFFIIGSIDGIKLDFPDQTHIDKEKNDGNLLNWVTAGEALLPLDDGIINEDERVRGKWGHLLNDIPPGENYLYYTKKRGHPNPIFKARTKFWTFLLKLSPDSPSWTIQANPANYQGPFHWNNRKLRIPELKALQSIDPNWDIEGDEKSVRSQIGDACPPPLIECIAKKIIEQTT
ncbi:MAG: DNA cytosine methyltransferase [Candidatus Heimdallarchaeaceae archaeon]